jgi:DNA ligase 1
MCCFVILFLAGAWYGRGKRTGVFGSFLLAIYNEEGEEFQTISKIGTGFSEEDLDKLSEQLRGHVIDVPR